MMIAVIVAVPLTWHLAPYGKGAPFRAVGYVAIATALIFLAIGVRQVGRSFEMDQEVQEL